MSIIKMKWFLVSICLLWGLGAVGQKYYLAKEGNMSIYFGYKNKISVATTEQVDIILDKSKIILWITVRGSDFSTGNKRIDKRLFRKNQSEFVIKADIKQEDVIYGENYLLQFSLVGRVFNKVEGEPVSIMGAFGDSLKGKSKNASLDMYFGVESKWLGERFLKHSDYSVVNIRIEAELEPLDQDRTVFNRSE